VVSTYLDRFAVSGRRALVTGGSKGIGAEVARLLAEAGADIAIVGRDAAGLAETARAVRATGRSCHVIEADLASTSEIRLAAESALRHFGTVDILVYNAGISHPATILDADVEAWDATLAVNLRAPFLLAQLVVPGMIAQGHGKIVNVSSQAGVIGLEAHAAYCASKGGLNMLTKVMAIEFGPHNIQVNAVAPTVILTPMGVKVWGDPVKSAPMLAKIPLGRFGEPIEVADLVLFLASSASNLITGETILIDGGYTAL